jgi:hypothetical protein
VRQVVCRAAVIGVAAVSLATGSSAAVPPKKFLLRLNDGFDVAGLKVACLAQRRAGAAANILICFQEDKSLSYKPWAGAFSIAFGEGGLAVVRNDIILSRVFLKKQHAPSGIPPGQNSAQAVAAVAELRPGDKAYVAGTHIVCDVSPSPRSLICSLVGGDGKLLAGDYSALITDRNVLISQVLGSHIRTVKVFSR